MAAMWSVTVRVRVNQLPDVERSNKVSSLVENKLSPLVTRHEYLRPGISAALLSVFTFSIKVKFVASEEKLELEALSCARSAYWTQHRK